MDPDNYEDPEVFNPGRFLPENQHSLKEYSFLPFASGPRNCIGMRFALLEMKYALVIILIKFRFEACDQTKVRQIFSKLFNHIYYIRTSSFSN